ncbi:hypothetical protein P20480_2707 [Pseudoalteromonas sp. BSi20480]|nr:hypothetical protein P20480_2707 [Pseudoalteromonas sp. BSi20480]
MFEVYKKELKELLREQKNAYVCCGAASTYFPNNFCRYGFY